VIKVVEEGVEGTHALINTARQFLPFIRRNNTGYHVKRDQALLSCILAIDVESNTGAPKHILRILALLLQPFRALRFVPLAIAGIGGTHIPVGIEHLVIGRDRGGWHKTPSNHSGKNT
jgi:hypothetical protein